MPVETFSIAPFDMEHYEAAFDLWEHTRGVGLSGADERQPIAAYLQRNPGLSFVALDNGKVVGTILSGHDGRRGYIHHLAVDESRRRRGIGRQLVDRSLLALEAQGIQKCHLFIFHENQEGIDFWQSQGWTLRHDIKVMSQRIANVEE